MTITYHIDDVDQVARQIIAQSEKDVFIFNAPMGAGKTTLITSMCRQLGVTEEISSPTFSIVNEYLSNDKPIYHFDLYRLEREEELFDIGFEDYLDKGAIILIEWPELALPFIEEYTHISIEIIDPFSRILTVN